MKDLREDPTKALVAVQAQQGREACPKLGGSKHEHRRWEQLARGGRVLREEEVFR